MWILLHGYFMVQSPSFMVAFQKSNPYFMCRTDIEISGSNANYKDNSLTDGTVAYLIIF